MVFLEDLVGESGIAGYSTESKVGLWITVDQSNATYPTFSPTFRQTRYRALFRQRMWRDQQSSPSIAESVSLIRRISGSLRFPGQIS